METEEEPAIDPKTLRPIRRRDFKEVARLKKGIGRFLRYHRDLISDDDFEAIHERSEDVETVLKREGAQRIDLEHAAEKLTKQCEAAVPNFKYSALRENLEVFFVAVVLAMAIRTYFGQPSRIPTGSMQPTLNGIIAYPDPETTFGDGPTAPHDYEFPNRWQRICDKIWYGRSHVEMVSDREDFINLNDGNRWFETQEFKLFPQTTLMTERGQIFKVPGTQSRVERLLSDRIFEKGSQTASIEKGDVIARGYVDTGDWVVVDRLTYHWRKPKRDDIFVFTTHDIPGATRTAEGGEQHYIKRLVGVPGDRLNIEPPNLFVNGELATEFGIRRVIEAENGYTGFQFGGGSPVNYADVPEGKYVAFGDNSKNSRDSRNWGFVPAKNITGRALMVYYPFGHHFGPVR